MVGADETCQTISVPNQGMPLADDVEMKPRCNRA